MAITRRNLPPFSTLLAFEATARLGSFTEAGRELHVSQAAVSQKVRELESWIGGELVARTRPRLTTTPEGLRLADSIRSAVTTVTRSVEATRKSMDRKSRVVLATTNTFALYWLGSRIESFYSAYPDMELSLVTSDREVTEGIAEFDLAVTFAPVPPVGYEAQLLFHTDIVAIANPKYLADRPSGLEPGAWHDDVLLHLSSYPALTWAEWYSMVCLPEGPESRAGYFSTYITLMQAVLAGRGIGLGWRILIDPLLQSGDVVQIGDRSARHSSAYYLISRSPMNEAAPESIQSLCKWFTSFAETGS